jgi:uncharacterized protein YbbC (DUF1343 family)
MIKFGIDCLLQNNPTWKNKRIGLVTNQAATTNGLIPSRFELIKQKFNIQKLFSPEHGLDVLGADGQEMMDGFDTLTGLPIISLYSNKLAPSEEDLADIDIVLFDIPDIGCRFYTYLWTLTYVMEACAKNKKKCIILDRPNPISGNLDLAEGPILMESQSSFIGRWPIPIRHSCTLGELAKFFNAFENIGCDLEIIVSEGWVRNSFQPNWGIQFVPTSPAIQSFESMLFYPGLCLLEATNISEGRGTENAFCILGAPWIKGTLFAGILNDMGLDEVAISIESFTPSESKYKNQLCNGVRLSLREPTFFQPVSYGLILIRLIKQMYPQSFEWKPYPTLVNPTGQHHLDKLLGIPDSKALFELPLSKFIAEITKLTQCKSWKQQIEGYLLY